MNIKSNLELYPKELQAMKKETLKTTLCGEKPVYRFILYIRKSRYYHYQQDHTKKEMKIKFRNILIFLN